MKRLTCEMCGGTEFVKDGDFFVCQSCGLKYTLENARKMMQDDSAAESGSAAKPDESDKVRKLLQLARRAREEENGEDAKKYYELAMMEDPDNWESAFYASYYRVMESPLARLEEVLKNFNNRAKTTLGIILNTYTGEEFQANIRDFFESAAKLYGVVSEHTSKRHVDLLAEVMTQVFSDAFSGNKNNNYAHYDCEHAALFELSLAAAETLMDLCETAEGWQGQEVDLDILRKMWNACDMIYFKDCMHFSNMYMNRQYERYLKGILKLEDRMLADWRGNLLCSVEETKRMLEKLKGLNGDAQALRQAKKIFNDHREARAKRFAEEYWNDHPVEKKALDDEKAGLQQEIDDLLNRKNALYNNSEMENMRKEVQDLEGQKNKCGLFQFKEKKALQEKIDAANVRIDEIRKKISAEESELRNSVDLKKQRIKEIEETLSKEGK